MINEVGVLKPTMVVLVSWFLIFQTVAEEAASSQAIFILRESNPCKFRLEPLPPALPKMLGVTPELLIDLFFT